VNLAHPASAEAGCPLTYASLLIGESMHDTQRLVLGMSAFYHDSAAAIVRDGEIAGAASEERFTRRSACGTRTARCTAATTTPDPDLIRFAP